MQLQAPVVDADSLNATLHTPRLRLEPLAGHHAPLLYEGMCEPAIYQWISMPRPESLEQLTRRWTHHAERLRTQVDVFWLAWAVQRTSDGAWIGEMDAEVQADGIATNVGYFFLPAYWGQGLGSEATTALCDHFAACGVVEQRAMVTLGNLASERVLERAGFVRTAILRENDELRGVKVDDVVFVRRDPRVTPARP